MKTFILIAASVSVLCAGPVIQPLINYDQEDTIQAKTEVKQKLILPEIKQPAIIAPGVRKKTFNYELDLLAGENFADDQAVIKDATAIGIRLNRYITDTVAIQLGYDRIFDADYKLKKRTRSYKSTKTVRTGAQCSPCPPCQTEENIDDTETPDISHKSDDTDNGSQYETVDNGGQIDNGTITNDYDMNDGYENNDELEGLINEPSEDDTGNSNINNNTPNNNNGAGGISGNGHIDQGGKDGNTENPLTVANTKNLTQSTDIDRFYLNLQKEIRPEKTNLIPYFFAGVGYEYVNDESLGLESQGFFNTGGGLKYSLSEKFRFVSEAKVIKKFKDRDLDVVATLGVGVLFGENEETAPETEPEPLASTNEPRPENQDLTTIIIDDDPQPKSEVSPPVAPLVIQPIERVRLDLNELRHSGDYYVQVAAVSSKHRTDKLIDKLEQHHLRVVVKTATVRGKEIKRILVGPYMQRSEAKADLPEVRKVSKGAFIKKIS